ncbi:bactofilin family protein [Roseicyclus persicicus]|uniref:Polymer-forming cytoskeletal protein n=1 Tax=Roseicyclus persicicus TaxID=2650661 RepID=A0A7X6K0Z6_9RHOB|nr:polymer-forming cytoskeletal protein [Roseibacterium persicicum]NKX46393.1 polymer-forming cytoskeletal protein [Roseibacterium persicicum]
MFSKSKINEPGPKASGADSAPASASDTKSSPKPGADMSTPTSSPKSKPNPSILSSDLTVTGNLRTTGDIQVEGTVQGDIRAHLLTVGESANIEGEIVADDIVVTGRVIGKVRGLKVRLTSTARVEGDIIHKTIAIESGAHFEGSVQRAEDPLSTGASSSMPRMAPSTPAPAVPRPSAAGPAPGADLKTS